MRVNAAERLIVALDQPHDPENPGRLVEVGDARRIVEKLEGLVSFFKVGWPLFLAEGGEGIAPELVGRGNKVFLDLKYGDIPETVKRLVGKVAKMGVDFLSLGAAARALRAAVETREAMAAAKPKILAVTLLTSLDDSDLRALGYGLSTREYVERIARASREAGCDGLVCSPREAGAVRKVVGDQCLIVTPGIRPAGSSADDHKRWATPADAVFAGADYLVVGRPIIRSADLRAAASRIIKEMQKAFDSLHSVSAGGDKPHPYLRG